ncbi:hypothetical protein FWG95_00570 [Candidatus Saccharibacteria bacterium]|nr:hypothetical protein [Candidatus Saccharibacteria bacterium]
MEYKAWRKRVIIVVTTLVIVIIGLAFTPLLSNSDGTPRSVITNFDQYVGNLPNSRRVVIEQTLTLMLQQNGLAEGRYAKDAAIRDGSYLQSYNDDLSTYVTFFIIDIPSLEQTYQMLDNWLNDSRSVLGDGTILITCPDVSQLIYDAFECTNLPPPEVEL